MKKTEKINNTVLKVVERIARNEVKKNCFDWPPICAGIFHQPKKPKNVKMDGQWEKRAFVAIWFRLHYRKLTIEE